MKKDQFITMILLAIVALILSGVPVGIWVTLIKLMDDNTMIVLVVLIVLWLWR